MDIFYTEAHRLRSPKTELCGGELVPPFECAERVDIIRARCLERGIGALKDPGAGDPSLPQCVHSADYVAFLGECWRDWQAAGYKGEALPSCWPSRAMPRAIIPHEIEGRLGYYALAAETAISGGTYEAALAAAACAAAAADALQRGAPAFALCRPPGHHAATDMYGGYCFFNNVAIAAQRLIDGGAARAAVLDVDFHHGNGTQEIFYRRDDVLFASIHGDPLHAFPHFLGHADETGEGAGEGCNVNYPLPPGAGFSEWDSCLQQALERIARYAPACLLVSLGVDAYKDDPISFFKLDSGDFHAIGKAIARLNIPTAFIMEGGYAVKEIGINTVNVLEGFMEA